MDGIRRQIIVVRINTVIPARNLRPCIVFMNKMSVARKVFLSSLKNLTGNNTTDSSGRYMVVMPKEQVSSQSAFIPITTSELCRLNGPEQISHARKMS